MTCAICGGETAADGRCPTCEADRALAPRTEGALAAEPRLLTPPARSKPRVDPMRDVPALRKREARERSWREEVQDRVRSRRQKRADAGLPLFDEPNPLPPLPEAPPALPPRQAERVEVTSSRGERSAGAAELPGGVGDARLASPELSEVELADLPLRGFSAAAPPAERQRQSVPAPVVRPLEGIEDEDLSEQRELEPEIRLESPLGEPAPVERPARAGERAQAAAIDAALFALLCAVVLYFTGRTARVGIGSLAPAWPWLVAYQGLLATFYAGYFTGTTGQTPGKLLTGLRVVETSGRPPGYLRAAGRGLAGLLGIALAGLALVPMAFDPALRALHDRLFQTRVIRG